MKSRPRICYYSRSSRDCIYWLCAAGVFGGAPVAVYFSAPGAKVFNLFLAAILGLPCLALSLWSLGRTTFLALHTDEKILVYGQSVYHRRAAEAVEFSLIERTEWRSFGLTSGGKGATSSRWHEVHVCLKDGRRLLLQQPGEKLAELRAKKIAALVGVPVRQGAGGLPGK